MKKAVACFVIAALLLSCIGCTLASLPNDGIWYNEKLKLVVDFEQNTAYSYDENLSAVKVICLPSSFAFMFVISVLSSDI